RTTIGRPLPLKPGIEPADPKYQENSLMRTTALIAANLVVYGLAFAAQTESVIYTGGNLTGIATQSNAVLDLSQDQTMRLRVGRTDVSIPYSSITKTDSADSALVPPPGRKASKQAQQVTIDFKSVQGDWRTMTLHMSNPAASHVLTAIRKHVPAVTAVA